MAAAELHARVGEAERASSCGGGKAAETSSVWAGFGVL